MQACDGVPIVTRWRYIGHDNGALSLVQFGLQSIQLLLAQRARLLRSPQPPTAVFVCNDMMAIGALHAAHEAGIEVPRRLSVVGFDDIELAAYTSPPLTTVAQPKEAIGTGAAGLLLERLRDGRTAPRRSILPAQLHLRASTTRPQS